MPKSQRLLRAASPSRRTLLRGAVGGAVGAALAGALPSARACEFFARTLRITHPWARSTGPGDDSVLVHMKFDEVLEDDRLVAVATPLAEGVEFTTPGGRVQHIDIPAGQELLLGGEPDDPPGAPTLRLVGLTERLSLGTSHPLRLQFARGGVVNATLNIDFGGLRFSRTMFHGLSPSC